MWLRIKLDWNGQRQRAQFSFIGENSHIILLVYSLKIIIKIKALCVKKQIYFTYLLAELLFCRQEWCQWYLFPCWCSGTLGGSQWPVWGADWPGKDCQEDHAPCPDIAQVWALLCSVAGGHWVTGRFTLPPICLSVYIICSASAFFFF